MRKHRFAFFVWLITGLLILLLLVVNLSEVNKVQAQTQLEQAINKSYNDENELDIESLKDNIRNDIPNAEVINEEISKFPIQTVVDGYEFKIEEDGKIENIDNSSENLQNKVADDDENNNIYNEVNNNSIENNDNNNLINNELNNEENIEDEPTKEEENLSLVKYTNDVKEDKGISILTTENGIVTINGTSTKKLFIKISNGIEISNTAESFNKWKEEDGIVINRGKKIKQKVTVLNNIVVDDGQVNVVLRTESNNALGIIKLLENETESNVFLRENIIANYVYVSENMHINNMKFKVEITEEPINNELKLREEVKVESGVECAINKDGTVKLNGTSTANLFIKITNGMDIATHGDENSNLAKTEPILFEEKDKIYLKVQPKEGECITQNNRQEFNFVLKYDDGNIATNCKIKNNILNQEFVAKRNVTMGYLFIAAGVNFEEYVIEPIVYNLNMET